MPFSVACGACGASFKLSQEIYERRIKGRKVALRCKKCQAEIPVDGTKLEDGTIAVATTAEPGAPPVPADPNVSFMPQPPVTETSIKEPPLAVRSSAPEILPRDTSWFPSGGSTPAPPVTIASAEPLAVTVPEVVPEPPPSEQPTRGPMDTPRVPIAVGREAMPTPRNLDADALASAAAQAGEFNAPEPPTKPGNVAVAERLAATVDGSTPRTPDAAALAAASFATQNTAAATTPSAPEAGASTTGATPRAAEARAPSPRAVPRPKFDSKTEQPAQPKAGARQEPLRAKQEFKKPELPSRPKQEAPKPELPSRPKPEFLKPELPSRPKQEVQPKPEPSRPKQEAPPKPELPSRPKQEAPPKPELPSRPRQESRPDLEPRAEPPPRPKLESRPNLTLEPASRPRQESRPRLESEPRLAPSPEEEARARAVATHAVAKALASAEPKAPEPAVEPIRPPAGGALAAGSLAVSAVPQPRPISIPPIRPSLPPGRRWAFIGGLAAALVVALVVLGWLLSTVSSQPGVTAPSASAPVASAAPPRATAEEEQEEEEEPASTAGAATPSPPSPIAPVGSAPGLLEQAVANLNSQADDRGGDGKSFDREAAMKALDLAANRASRCRSKGDPSGNVTVLVIFNPSGTVKEARVVDTRYDGRATARCIASRMAQARIRPFEGSPKTLAKSVAIP